MFVLALMMIIMIANPYDIRNRREVTLYYPTTAYTQTQMFFYLLSLPS